MLGDHSPDPGFRLVGQRVDLHQAELLIPANDAGLGSVFALIAANRTDPGMLPFGTTLEDFDLAIEAALGGIRFIERAAVDLFVLFNRVFWLEQFDIDAELLANLIANVERFLELVARVEIENRRIRGNLGKEVKNYAPFRSEGGSHGQLQAKTLGTPTDDLFGRGRLEPLRGFGQLGHQLWRGLEHFGSCLLLGSYFTGRHGIHFNRDHRGKASY
mmetsp:Transcript_27340/g.60383  ORF Transcript_27340/g.60383 Transcript_27340/m.60383 type:complete len:216 (-) Transcript_27340:27-674(-)